MAETHRKQVVTVTAPGPTSGGRHDPTTRVYYQMIAQIGADPRYWDSDIRAAGDKAEEESQH